MYKIIAVTPAGRRRYMRLLVPYLLSSDKIDRYDIWVNTENKQDIAFLEALSAHEKIRLISQPNGIVDGNRSINAFFKYAQDDREVYIRFDDDIVWMECGAIDSIVEFRLSHPECFIVSPYVINNAMCSALLQLHGKLPEFPRVKPYAADPEGWVSADFADKLHRAFLAALNEGDLADFRGKDTSFAACRFSINCVSWFGKDLRPFDRIFEGDEEEQLSFSIPALANRCNSIIGSALVAHFAFFTQREHLDQTDILARYLEVRNRTSWLTPDAIKFVEDAYVATSGGEVDLDTVMPTRTHLVNKIFNFPVAIRFKVKTRKTSVAQMMRPLYGR